MVVMVEVHVVNALLAQTYRQTAWFSVLNFVNGLVAPSFLFVAGFVFMQAWPHARSASLSRGTGLWPRAGRLALIWVLGYLLHCPSFSLSVWRQGLTPEQWQAFLGVDVLQCIAVSLLLLALIRLAWPRPDRAIRLAALAGLLAVLLAGPLYRADIPAIVPAPLAAYLVPYGATLFPLLPWFGFVAAGAVAALVFARAYERNQEASCIRSHLLAGLVLTIVGLPLLLFLRDHLHWIGDERPHLLFFASRLGFVYLIVGACYHACRNRQNLGPLLAYPARVTLLIYCLHLQLLYHPFGQAGSLASVWQGRADVLGCAGITLGLLGLMLAAAWLWHNGKRRYPRLGSATVGIGGLLMTAWFFLT